MNNNESKMSKDKVVNKKKHKIKFNQRLVNDGIDYQKEQSKSKKLDIEFRKDNELVCEEYDKLNRKSVNAETRNDALVDQLKDQICRAIFIFEEEKCF